MTRTRLVLFALLLASTPASAQSPETTDTRVLELQTAGYYELEAQAQALGLATTGTAAELRTRIAASLGLSLPPPPAASGQTLTVDSAQEAGLVTVQSPDGKLLQLSGGLQVTLVDNDKRVTHTITADQLWYDQKGGELTARGNVVYTLIRDTSREVFRGESLTFRLDNSQGVFYGGASDRTRTVGSQALVFRYQGDAIRRSDSDLVVLDVGTITSSLSRDPYYRILAKRIWVLAPGEWGLQDAVLYLGRVPVMAFPFFFQPGDDFFFNPVLAFPQAGDRRGTALQTTTYLLGKKTRDQAPLSFLQVADSGTQDERVRRGLFLVRGTPPPTTVNPAWTLRYLADFYSSLGLLTAVDGSLPGALGLKTLTFSAGLGVTRTVDADGTPFSGNPFQWSLDPWSQSDWNGSWLGSARLPFRWGGGATVEGNWGTASLEYYSDPQLYNDLFANRSENFSVFSLLGMAPAAQTASTAVKSTLQWSLNATLQPVSASAGLLWSSKTASPSGPSGDPENSFYVPSQLTLPQAALNLSGTLWPITAPPLSKADALVVAALVPPPAQASGPGAGEGATAAPTEADAGLAAPARLDSVKLPADSVGWAPKVTWSLRPEFKTDTRFDSSGADFAADPSWKVLTSRWNGAWDGKLNLSAAAADGVWAATEAVSARQQLQSTWYLGPGVTDAQKPVYQQQDDQQSSTLASQSLAATWKPWAVLGPWRDTAFQYTFGSKLWDATSSRTLVFDGTSDTVTAHQASAALVFYPLDQDVSWKAQAGWQSTLPPLEPLRTYSASLDWGVGAVRASTKASARQTESALLWDAWVSSAQWNPLPDASLQETFQFDLQSQRPLSSTSVATWAGLSLQYRQQRTTPYTFDTVGKSWVAAGDQDFLPQELRLGYNLNLPALQWWYARNTLSAKVDLSWPINLQQYSQMPLSLNYTVAYKLARFLDLQVTEGVVNRTAYRYFPFLAESFGPGAVSAVNPLVDFWDSLSVWDPAALRRTGFKMTNLTVGLVHYLDDWQVKLDYSGAPQLTTGAQPQFRWAGTLTLLVQWYPVPELRTQMQWDKDGNLAILKSSP